MPNLSAMSPITIGLTDTLLKLVQGLQSDKVYRAVVSHSPEGLSVKVNGARIALPQNSAFVAGQAVTIQLQTHTSPPQILVQLANAASGGTPVTRETITILQQAMSELPGFPSLSAQEGATLFPSAHAIIRLALQIFQIRAQVPEAVEILIRTLRQLVARGEAKPDAVQLLALLGGDTDLSKPDSIAQFLRLVQTHTQQQPLAGMSGHTAASTPNTQRADTHLYLLLAGMRNNQSVRAMLDSGKARESFQRAIETLVDHTAGQHLQNARALEILYSYMNLPFGDGALRQVQIHILGEGQGQNDWGDGKTGQIVLDLETSRLGIMWIHIRHTAEQCTCRFEVASEEIAAHISRAVSSLEARLEGISFKQVRVTASVWDGDRMTAIAALLQPYSGLDVTA